MGPLASLGIGLWFATLLGGPLTAASPVFAAELAEIQARGYLIVAVKDNWRPLGFRNQAGELVGLEIDIARRLAEVIFDDPNALELVPVANSERLTAVLTDEVDIAVAGVTLTPDRMRVVHFSVPYYLDGIGLISRDRRLTGLNDLDQLDQGAIAVLNDSAAVSRLNFLLPQAPLIGVDSYQEAKALLDQGTARAFAGDLTVLAGWEQEYPEYRLLPSLLSSAPLVVTMPKGLQYRPLQDLVDDSLNQWHESGWLEDRATYWGLP
ncbi:ABC transporter substrate-binding protein [filamentous cyanobacterium CCP5]|nr:ABC transporter substrate-binding protein [filamentous cyanobacterium CCP5]